MKNDSPTRRSSGTLAFLSLAFLLCIAVAGCGGGYKKSYDTYGQTEATFKNAPSIISTISGDLQLVATGSEWNVPIETTRVDPITGVVSVTVKPGTAARTLIVGFVLGALKPGGGFTTPITEWTPKTVWVFTDTSFISSQEIKLESGAGGVLFPDPPISKQSPARMTVEYVSGTRSVLVSAQIVWL